MKLLYNDEELDLFKFCHGEESLNGTKRCEYELFKERILEGTFENMKEECVIPAKDATIMGLEFTQFLMYLIAALTGIFLIFLSICCRYKVFSSNQKGAKHHVKEQPRMMLVETK